ncbi:hypothetical protein E4U14_003675 [Claviceps sp. LM454 group G7]|nr:hypothetical protein E4U14_003675 [Claviceps sp. LM454 group G7]
MIENLECVTTYRQQQQQYQQQQQQQQQQQIPTTSSWLTGAILLWVIRWMNNQILTANAQIQ